MNGPLPNGSRQTVFDYGKGAAMKLIKTVGEMQEWSRRQKESGKKIGLVPTMGFLHEGHLSLIDTARREGADSIVVSIFVNPTQFGPNEDFDRYPRDLERDQKLCEERGVDAIFLPDPSDMYYANHSSWVVEECVSQGLCGESRPNHFRGVATVVAKLFNSVLPDLAVFGQKDAQQAAVIKRMVRDLNFPVEIIIAPIVREKDGLAMSSRNKYLSGDERSRALALSQSLHMVKELFESGAETNAEKLADAICEAIPASGGVVDYVDIRDADTMEHVTADTKNILFATAAFYGKTRLIDNIIAGKKS